MNLLRNDRAMLVITWRPWWVAPATALAVPGAAICALAAAPDSAIAPLLALAASTCAALILRRWQSRLTLSRRTATAPCAAAAAAS